MKKLGIILIVIGLISPLILLIFFGDNWVPAKQAGIIYSILNSELVFVEEEKHSTKTNYKSQVDLSYLDVEKVSVPFRYIAGSGLIFVFGGSIILIKEFKF